MKKYAEPIYNRQDIQKAMKITLWERFCLMFIKKKRVDTEKIISHYKTFRGKFYLLDFALKTPQKNKESER